jgi:hypothetical protein
MHAMRSLLLPTPTLAAAGLSVHSSHPRTSLPPPNSACARSWRLLTPARTWGLRIDVMRSGVAFSFACKQAARHRSTHSPALLLL